LSSERDHIKIVYLLRRAPSSTADSALWIAAKNKIQEIFSGKIVPFAPGDKKFLSYENTGFRIKIDKHDLNSFRIDINILEDDGGMTMSVISSPMILSLKGLSELIKINEQRPTRCFVSFEMKDSGKTTPEEYDAMLKMFDKDKSPTPK
jgi:hypothetical protein